MSDIQTLKIGTRGSPLAMVQTRTVEALLKNAYPDLKCEIIIIKTAGDWKPEDGETRLSDAKGGKAQFATEIEDSLLKNDIDIAVHSMKDMDSWLPEGLCIEAMLPREDVRDALLFSNKKKLANNSQFNLETLPDQANLGTASVRREAFLKSIRPDINVAPLRGNVQTRINKVREGQVDATFLAMAGLNRLGLSNEADLILDTKIFTPAAGQGAVGIECRSADQNILQILKTVSCEKTLLAVKAERAAIQTLNGNCHSPIGAYAKFEGQDLHLHVRVSSNDGQRSFEHIANTPVTHIDHAIKLGRQVADKIKSEMPDGFLS